MKLYIVEDDEALARGMRYTLEQEGFEVQCFCSAAQGRRALERELPNLLLLDWNLPDGDGLELCRWLKSISDVPVLMVTARDLEMDQVICLEEGVDDYVAKPFSLAVLKARIRALLRRSCRQEEGSAYLSSGDIRLSEKERKVWKAGGELELSRVEYKLLNCFLENKNQVLLKEQLLDRVWDGDFVEENTLTASIRRLRRKVEEDPAHPRYIKTVHGMGYLWEEKKS